MGIFERMLSTQSLMFLYILVGVIIVKTGVLKREARSSFIGLLINVTVPCLVLHSFEQEATLETLAAGARVMAISTAVMLASWLLGLLLWRRKPPRRQAVLKFAAIFSNSTYAGLPIVELVFGAEGILYASFFNIPAIVLTWTLGLSLFVKDEGASRWRRMLLNPGFLAVFAGVGLMLSGLRLPVAVSAMLTNLGGMTGPLSMMIIGASLAEARPREVLDADVFLAAAVRLAALPLASMVALRLLGTETLLWQVAVTLIAMPVAANTAILSEMYGADHAFAAKCVVVSTMLSLVTVPCLTLLF